MIWRYSSSFIVRSSVILTKTSNIWSGITYLPFFRILNCFLFAFFYLTFCRYALKHDKAWTLKMSYTRLVSLWKLQVLFLIRSETWEIILGFVWSPSQKIVFSDKLKMLETFRISNIINLIFLLLIFLCFFDLFLQ